MPRIKSAIKRVEVAERNREKNRHWKSQVRTLRNKVEETASDPAKSAEALKEAFSVIDSAVSKGVLHKNTAARRKSRLVRNLKKAQKA
ncbi:MAG: 30S ribosomal protein S20 [Candidatus Obscuribacterales bacterium]|nr:30S ribosomal protein S20 [Candidatus Obscuribacterales bacterium]